MKCFTQLIVLLIYSITQTIIFADNLHTNIQDSRPVVIATNYLTAYDINNVAAMLVVSYPCNYGDKLKEITNYTIVRDKFLARRVFGKLQHSPLVKGHNLMWENGRPVLFLNKNDDLICGFRFWAGHSPRNMFQLHISYNEGKKYYFGGPDPKGMVADTVADEKALNIRNALFIDKNEIPD